MKSPFEFTDHVDGGSDDFVARIPLHVLTTPALLSALAAQLQLPSYFGHNWDALSDCLRDLHWVARRNVVLVHAEVPRLPAAELQRYLDVLAHAVASWQPDDAHALRVIFPRSARLGLAVV